MATMAPMDSDRLKALADDNRVAIVGLLAERERCVCELADRLGLSEALISHHVKRLHAAGIVSTRRVGRWLHCRLDGGGIGELAEDLRRLAEAAQVAPRTSEAACSGAKVEPKVTACG